MTYKIKVSQDTFCENPREDWGCLPTLFTFWGRNFGNNVYWTSLWELLRVKNLTSKKSKLLKAMSIDDDKYRKEWIADDTESALQYYIWQIEDDEVLNEVLNIIWYKTYYWTSRWYSQWDVINCILVADEKWIKETGVKVKDIEKSLKSSSEIFDARARWDVYTVSIYEIIPLYRVDWTLSWKVEEECIDWTWCIYWCEELKNQYSYVKNYVTQEEFEEAIENIEY